MAVSKCVGPSVSKVVSLVDNCFKPPSKLKEDEKFQISDEELDKFLSEVDWSKIDEEVQRRTISENFSCRTVHSLTVPLTFRLLEISNTKSIVVCYC
jgi:hypothetical protein